MPTNKRRINNKLVVLVPDDWDYVDRDRKFAKLCLAGQDLFMERNRQYGDAIRFGGLKGAVVELIGCVMRLQQLVMEIDGALYGNLDEEAIINALQDTHNYSNIACLMLEEGNINGKMVATVEEQDENFGSNSD